MQNWGPGDTILAVVLALCFLLGPVGAYVSSRRENRLIRAVQALELGEGVTLLQGVRALFGEDGLWLADGNTVHVLASFAGRGLSAGMVLRIDAGTGRMELFETGGGDAPSDGGGPDGLDALIRAMVRAGKSREGRSEGQKSGGAEGRA